MAQIPELTRIAAQKQILQAQGEVYRAALRVQIEDLRASPLSQLSLLSAMPRGWTGLALAAVASAGVYLGTRRLWPTRRWFFQALTLWQLLRRIGAFDLLRRYLRRTDPGSHPNRRQN